MVAYIPFLKENLGLSIKETGIYSSIGFMFVGFGAYFGVLILNKGWKKNLESLLALGLFMAGLFHILMCVENLYWSFVFRLFHEIGDGFVFIVFYVGGYQKYLTWTVSAAVWLSLPCGWVSVHLLALPFLVIWVGFTVINGH